MAAAVGPGQDHRRWPGAVARPRLQRLSAPALPAELLNNDPRGSAWGGWQDRTPTLVTRIRDAHPYGPALRRALVNAALAQESAAYYAALASYGKHLAQKNALLRGLVAADEALLTTYNERLIESGTELILARRAFVTELEARASAIHHAWVGDVEGDLELLYAANVAVEVPTHDGVASAFAARLDEQRAAELVRKTSLVGPHRDDVEFRLGGRPLAAFGSQGQQRTAVLALKVAEYETLFAYGGEAPILLLDDVLSELDGERRAAFLRGVATVEQVFVTTTSEVDARAAATYRIEAAQLERVA